MKSLNAVIFIVILAAMCSCGQSRKNGQNYMDSTAMPVVEMREEVDPMAPAEIKLDRNQAAVVTGTIAGLRDMKSYLVKIPAGKKLSVKLTPDREQANIRIHQLISPSGEADGPFGLTLIEDITEGGVWTINIGESLMVGEDYTGGYTLSIILL